MASFLDEAQELLTEDEYSELKTLNRKQADFESTNDEETRLLALKNQVRKAIAERDKVKHLDFLKSGAFTLAEVIKYMAGTDEENVRKAVAEALRNLYPAPEKKPVHIADYPNGANKDHPHQLIMNGGLGTRNDILKDLVEKGGIATLVKNLTDEGKEWITAFSIPDKGPFKGKKTYHNINAVCTRFKTFKKVELKKALKIAE